MNSNYGWGLPVQASSFAKDIDFGLNLIHVVMVGIFVIWGIFFVYLLIRYRQQEGVRAHYEEPNKWWSLAPDLVVLVFDVGLLALYAIPAWNRVILRMPPPEESQTVQVVAEQFAWNVHYPGVDGKFGRRDAQFIDSDNVLGLDPEDADGKDDVTSVNEMHVPLGKKTVIHLTSKDVIHSFFVPEFRVKMDAVPGLRTKLWFEPIMLGKFEIGCAQLCGLGHTTMRGDVYVDSPEDYEAWLAKKKAAAAAAEDEDEE